MCTLALVLGLVGSHVLHVIAGIIFVPAYGVYLWRTLARHRAEGGDEEPGRLLFDRSRDGPPGNAPIITQSMIGVGMIVGGAQLFVTQVDSLAHDLGIAALVLALVLTPLASELPEKINSVL